MILLYIVGFIIIILVVVTVVDGIQKSLHWKKLEAARAEYAEIEKKYGYIAGREHCPHRVVEFGQTGVPGVVTLTTKWCKVCKKHLGSAKLKTSIFGNRWE
jgi:hypothetical protein